MDITNCEDSADRGHDDFNNREDLYRTRRDDFRKNQIAMNELVHWKACDNNMEYKYLWVSSSPPSPVLHGGWGIKRSGTFHMTRTQDLHLIDGFVSGLGMASSLPTWLGRIPQEPNHLRRQTPGFQ